MPTRASLTIAKQELKAFLDRPTGYVLLAVFVALVDFLFFRQAFIGGEASLRPLFATIPWVFLVFVPAVTMRLLAEEERSGTMEVLLTQPLTELDIIVGKFLGGLGIVGLAFATTLPVPLGLSTAGRLDWGVVFTQYFAGVMLGAAMVAIGLFASSITRNQVLASMAAATISFFLVILGFDLVTLAVPRRVGEVLAGISLLARLETMARGVIDLRDLLYFLSVVLVFGLGAYLVVHAKRTDRKAERFYNLQLGAILLIGITVALNLLVAPYALRLDLTANRRFTLSRASKQVVGQSPDDITITLFASRDLPPQVTTTYRDTRDLLKDYASISKRISFVERFPDIDPQASQAAEALGVQPVQFNVLEREQFSVKQGWLGVALQMGTKREAIPFVQRTDDLEYQVTSLIRKMEGIAKATVAFTQSHNEKPLAEIGSLRNELAKTYTVRELTRAESGGLDLAGVRVLVVPGPQTAFSPAERTAVKRFIEGGGKALFMLEGYTVNQQFLIATPNQDNGNALVSGLGVTVEKKLLYDLQSNETVNFSGGQLSYTVPYPFWPRLAAQSAQIAGDIDSVVLPWASPVSVSETRTPRNAVAVNILSTSRAAGAESGQPSIAPDREFASDRAKLAAFAAAVAMDAPKAAKPWRVVVIGDSDFVTDNYVRNAPENLAFALNAIDWLAQDETLSGIRSKGTGASQLRFDSFVQQLMVAWGNQFGVPIVIVGVGTWHLVMRRRRARRGDAR